MRRDKIKRPRNLRPINTQIGPLNVFYYKTRVLIILAIKVINRESPAGEASVRARAFTHCVKNSPFKRVLSLKRGRSLSLREELLFLEYRAANALQKTPSFLFAY